MIAEGDRVVVRWTWRCTHEGAFMGLAATEKHPTLKGMAIYRVTGDKCVERWVQVGLYWRQLGARLAPGKVI
jgi:predicted ester cyclase